MKSLDETYRVAARVALSEMFLSFFPASSRISLDRGACSVGRISHSPYCFIKVRTGRYNTQYNTIQYTLYTTLFYFFLPLFPLSLQNILIVVRYIYPLKISKTFNIFFISILIYKYIFSFFLFTIVGYLLHLL